jgi:hypothetical protein
VSMGGSKIISKAKFATYNSFYVHLRRIPVG